MTGKPRGAVTSPVTGSVQGTTILPPLSAPATRQASQDRSGGVQLCCLLFVRQLDKWISD